ncbi:MAG: hypothetical protein NTY38_18185 [Acidobacteria bacterium]|nr:hypothetical protein [Acidobacteriota bacterium]
MRTITRRALLGGAAVAAIPAWSESSKFLDQYGFWDYTTPGAGGMEAYEWDDYRLLLDDMRQARMNSLMVCVKWATTGYQSRLPYLDQEADNKVIRSGNALLRRVIDEAHRRGIRVWLGAVVNCFDTAKFREKAYQTYAQYNGTTPRFQLGLYDADTPGVRERAVEIFTELAMLFPAVDGLEVEVEGSGTEVAHRIPLYEEWARRNHRPPFERIGHPFDPRTADIGPWRDYATEMRMKILTAVETAVRAAGFRGEMAMIGETGRRTYTVSQEVNLKLFHQQFPQWAAITYEYNKWQRRYAMMDVCIDQPKSEGLKVYYLGRGVMTWGGGMPISLEESWRMDVEDVMRFQPHGFWWFATGTVNDGGHVSLTRLKQAGFADGVAARRKLLAIARPLAGLRKGDR